MTEQTLRADLNRLAERYSSVARALEMVGYPRMRRRDHSFASLAQIIIGQQLSTKAADTISDRVLQLLGRLSPDHFLSCSKQRLREAGLSHQKIGYLLELALAIQTNQLALVDLPNLKDEEVMRQITAIKGLGPWSAHMYLIFSLGRRDIWPSGDLAVRLGFSGIMGWNNRPDEMLVRQAGEAYAPYRTALALLCWRFYSEAL